MLAPCSAFWVSVLFGNYRARGQTLEVQSLLYRWPVKGWPRMLEGGGHYNSDVRIQGRKRVALGTDTVTSLQTEHGSGCQGSCTACTGSELPESGRFLPSLALPKNTGLCNVVVQMYWL